PDRIVVGEVRGGELCDLLRALNTGHEGGCATVHANSAEDVPARLEALAALGGLDRAATHAQIAAALSIVIHVDRQGRQRSVRQIGLLQRQPSGLVETVPAWSLEQGKSKLWPGLERLERLLR
ncbi:MAG: Flp pilus assembly complex ATPase component TadA, partial [Propionibacteriaceae bacterium]|nr:Flp pilus assembly complex ATPase component TadA [Propionibacteriaceae bacterium]